LNKLSKVIVFAVVFVLPVVIFLFLKFFGQNRFAIPIFHQNGAYIEGCPNDTGQYTIPAFQLTELTLNQQQTGWDSATFNSEALRGKITLYGCMANHADPIANYQSNALQQLFYRFTPGKNVTYVMIGIDSAQLQLTTLAGFFLADTLTDGHYKTLTNGQTFAANLWQCGLRTPLYDQEEIKRTPVLTDLFVLVDREQRIRGYYNTKDRTEIDRLIDEIRVLIQEYDVQ